MDGSRMTQPGAPTLDQLRVFAVVAETGSFSAAARRLHRAQSAVSYAIANLEELLGLALFERGHRRPILTEAGRAVLSDAKRVGRLVDDLRARAVGLHAGLEAEIGLAVDVMFPTARLVAVLEAFAREFPTVALRLRIEALGAVVTQVLDRACGLGISGPMGVRVDGVEKRPLCQIELVPVCAPGHPLAAIGPPLLASALHEHVQLVLTDRSTLTEGQDFGVISPRTWRLGDLGAKHALLRAGLGWGNMPAHMVGDELRDGTLVRLDPGRAGMMFELLLIHRADTPPGPATAWLADRLAAAPDSA
jgi:DNA-binding transcriptional LysR family regulator